MRKLKFLVCDMAGGVAEPSPEEQWVSTAIQCLDKAVERQPGIIVISFIRISIRDREALVELCAVLKRNSRTKQCVALALLQSKHRKLIEDLKRANVDYIRYVDGNEPDLIFIRHLIETLGPADSLDRRLEILCPFLHYSQIDSQHEMAVCGAYLDRMVLGGRRLNELCWTDDHLRCEYHQHPRNMP